MRRSLFASLMLLVCTSLFADGTQLGTISGRVVDQSQAAIPGATVEATNTEKGTTRRTVTDADGKYIVPLLHPGTYKVSISLAGFDTFIAQNAVVEVGKTTSINATLKLTSTAETITVLGDVPVVDKTNASDTTTVSTQLAQHLPIGRTYQALALSVPGVVLPGNANANANFHGALFTDNLYLFDGIDTTDPTTGGFGQNFTYEGIQEVQVTTSGASAEFGRAVGGIINVITKSGTNEFKGSYREVVNNDQWNAQNKGVSPTSGARFARVKFDSLVRVHAATVGGPIWRDHAWFFGAYEWDKAPSPQRQTLDPKTPQNFVSVPRDHFYDVKATWQAAPSKLIVLKANESPTDDIVVDRHNGGINAIPRFAGDIGAMNIQNQGSKSRALQYSGVAMNMLAMEAGVASSKIHIDFRPFVADTPVHQDLSTGLFYNGPSIVGFLERTRSQADFATNYFRAIRGQTHDFKIGIDYQRVRSTVFQRFGGNQLYIDRSYDLAGQTFVPSQRRDYDAPIPSSSHGRNTALYVLDKFQIGHLSLNVGVRGEKQTGESDIAAQVVDTSNISPRISGTYDLRRDGKLLAVASYGRFYQNILQQFDDQFALLPPKTSFAVFNWDVNNNRWINTGHETLAGGNVSVKRIKPVYLDEFTLGLERQIGRNVGVSLRGIHRNWKNIIDDTITLSPGGTIASRIFVNLPEASRSYNALEAVFNKRYSDWGTQVSYTYSRSRGNQFGTINSDLANFVGAKCRSAVDPTIGVNGVIDCLTAASTNREGLAPYDRTHVVRAYSAYRVPIKIIQLVVSPVVTVQSGDTYQRQTTLAALSSIGVATGNTLTYYYERAGSRRLPTIYQLDFGTEATYPFFGVEVGLKGEVFNVTNAQRLVQATPNGVRVGTSRNSFQAPRAYRVTALVRF
ncbi:MAG TPA: TonB-dependent receptor [Thermoanaerobaculia bacterium]|nr:TonB-dependent receptor [Thermoanaerobaculia bacterium]